jgi:hypothetical protein
MKFGKLFFCTTILCAGTNILPAQETNDVQQLKQMMQQMQENFEKERGEDRQEIKALTEKVNQLLAEKQAQTAVTAAPPPTVVAPTNAVTQDQFKDLNDKVDSVVEAQTKVRPNEFNPAIGLVGETIFSYRSQGSDRTGSDRPGGFDVFQRSVELNVSASVDPFAKGWVVANATADEATGEATLGIEEAALQTTSLPWNLTLTAGRFFGEFGRLAYIHDHELPFVNRPLVLDEFIGGESRTDGAQFNWLPPIAHYVSVTLGVGDQFGGDYPNPNDPGTFRSAGKLNTWGRVSTYFDLTPDWQLEAGASGLWNPRTEDRGGILSQPNGSTEIEKERRLAGVDVKLNYVPLRNNQFRSFTWGTEALYSDNRFLFDPDGIAANGDEFTSDVDSFGLYSYVNYKWSRQWSAGFLFDWVQNPQNNRDEAYAYSPFVTFALSHWNQLRLQYTHTDRNAASGLHPDDAIYFQWAWIIGAHSHGWTQR